MHFTQAVIDNRLIIVEEAWVTTDLLEMGLAECVLDDDVKDGLTNTVLAVNECLIEVCLSLGRLFNDDLARLSLPNSLDVDILGDLFHSVNDLTRGRVSSQDLVNEAILSCKDIMHHSGIEDFTRQDSERVLVDIYV